MTVTTQRTSTLADRVRDILPGISARVDEAERIRKVPVQNVDALRETGFFRAFVPAKYGGLEVLPSEFGEASRLLATACPSTAWACGLMAVHAQIVANYSPVLQEEVWGSDPDTLVCSSIAPMGKPTKVDGGIRLSGEFSWSSGSEHAHWIIVGMMMPGSSGAPEPHFAIVPRSDFEIKDTWFAMGLRGTGSQDISINDVFVPEYRLESVVDLSIGTAAGFGTHDAPVYRLPWQPVFSLNFSAVNLGAGEALRDLYRARLSSRVRAYTGAKVGETAPALMRLAEATHELDAARSLLESDWRAMDSRANSTDPATPDEMAGWRSNQAYVTRLAVRAADRLFDASGGSAVRDENPMQRYWRDLHTGAAHAYSDYDVAAQVYGAHLAAVQPQEGLF